MHMYLFGKDILPTRYDTFIELFYIDDKFNNFTKNSLIRRLQGFISHFKYKNDELNEEIYKNL